MDTRKPIIFELAQPAGTTLTTDNLLDPNHPVNIKGQSGKRKGMAVMIKGRIYVAQGSNPQSNWVMLNDSTSYPSILYTELGTQGTTLSTNAAWHIVKSSALRSLYKDQGSYLKPVPSKLGFTVSEKGSYQSTISFTVARNSVGKGLTPIEFGLFKVSPRGDKLTTGSHYITELMVIEDESGTHESASVTFTGYFDSEVGEEFNVKARSPLAGMDFHVHHATVRVDKLF